LIHFLLFEAHGVVFMPLEQGGEVGEAAERFAGRASDFEVGRVGFRVGIAESRIDVGGIQPEGYRPDMFTAPGGVGGGLEEAAVFSK
jgi:hypothetical protein